MSIHRKFFTLGWFAFVILITSLIGINRTASAQVSTPVTPVTIYLFWGDGCPHCARARPYLKSLAERYPGVTLKEFEIYNSLDNQQLFNSMIERYNISQLAVPTIFVGPFYLQGYAEELNQDIEAALTHCIENGCPDAGEGIIWIPTATIPIVSPSPQMTVRETVVYIPQVTLVASTPTPGPTSNIAAQFTPTLHPGELSLQSPNTPGRLNQSSSLSIPWIGKVDLDKQSIILSTALIAFVDGFNPCSLWVLTMLLALTIHTGSRKKVLFIGLIFLTVTGAIYALFIAGLFSVLQIINYLGWVQVVIAIVALFFALVNIKDYFWYKEGFSLTIADDKKTGIFKRLRTVMDASQSFWGLAGATVVLAAGVSLVEFSCTAGFPVLWVNLLGVQKIGLIGFLLLLLLYMLIYQLDEAAIFLSALVTLKASRLEEKHGRILKLAGGMLMLTLAMVMLIDPSLFNNLGSSLVIFGLAFLVTLLILFIHRIVLPRFGIRIGTESNSSIR